MELYEDVSTKRSKRMKRYEAKHKLASKLSDTQALAYDLFGDETHLTREMVAERLRKTGHSSKFDAIMKFLGKYGRILK